MMRIGGQSGGQTVKGALCGCLVLGCVIRPAMAFPEGAPWDAAKDDGCLSCHFDAMLVEESPKIEVSGVPDTIRPDAVYTLQFDLLMPGETLRGLMISAWQSDDKEAGAFSLPEAAPYAQTSGAKARTTDPDYQGPLLLQWDTAGLCGSYIDLVIWANEANGDASPFGDRIHTKTLRLPLDAQAQWQSQ